MGKATKWIRGLLGLKNTDSKQSHSQKSPSPKKKWSFAKSHKEKDPQKPLKAAVTDEGGDDYDRHAVSKAAITPAQASAGVDQHTTSGRIISSSHVSQRGAGYVRRDEWAAVTVQSHFRAYLSRRALRALKALVKLQALVRGHLVRKQTAYALTRLQSLVRAQARARADRLVQLTTVKSSHFNHPGPATPEKSERLIGRATSMKHESILKRNGSKSHTAGMSERRGGSFTTTSYHHTDDDKSSKIPLQVDNDVTSGKRTLFHDQNNCPSFSTSKDDGSAFCTVDNSPTFYSASSSRCGSSSRGAFTPTKSDGSRSCFSNHSDHPNYMAYTESSKAKVRSLSAPKQRPQFERSSSTKRYSVHGSGYFRSTQRASAFANIKIL